MTTAKKTLEELADELGAAQTEVSQVVSNALLADLMASRRGVSRSTVVRGGGAAILEPARFWAGSLVEGSDFQAVANGLRIAAAKLMAGDTSFVMESCTGQLAWLSAFAVEMKAKADRPGIGASSQARYLTLSLRAQGAAAKLALSLAAMASVGPGGTVVVGDG